MDELGAHIVARVDGVDPLGALRAARVVLALLGSRSDAVRYVDWTVKRLSTRMKTPGLLIGALQDPADMARWHRTERVRQAATTSPPPPPAPTRAEASRADREQAAREAMRARLGLPPATQGGEQ